MTSKKELDNLNDEKNLEKKNNKEEIQQPKKSELTNPKEYYESLKKENQNKLHAHNLIEEASEIIEACIKCGMCKSLCPVFKVILEEKFSPRGHSILLQEKIINESLYKCTLCKACEIKCPLNLKICEAIIKAREASISLNETSNINTEFIQNIIDHGNPFLKNKNS